MFQPKLPFSTALTGEEKQQVIACSQLDSALQRKWNAWHGRARARGNGAKLYSV